MTKYTTTTTTLRVEETLNIRAFKLVRENTREEEGKYTSITKITKELREIDKTAKSTDIKVVLETLFEKFDKEVIHIKSGKKVRKHNLYPISINGIYEFKSDTTPKKLISKSGTIYNFHLRDVSEDKSFLTLDMFDVNGEVFKLTVFSSKYAIFNLLMRKKTALLGLELTFQGYLKKDSLMSLYSVEKLIKISENKNTSKIRDSFTEDFDWMETGAYSDDPHESLFTKHSNRNSTGFKAVPAEDGFKNSNESLIIYQLKNLLNEINSQVNHRSELTVIFSHLIKYMIARAKNLKANYSVSSDKNFLAALSFKADFIDYLTEVYMVNYSNSKIEGVLKRLEDLNVIKLISIEEMTKSASITLQKFNHDLKSATAFSINKDSVKLLKKHFNEDIEN